jgi:uncharacterized Zn finger protein (UPF0148 family)
MGENEPERVRDKFGRVLMRCDCGWRGPRDGCPMHPRQGYITCPRCGRIPDYQTKAEGREG